MRFSVFEVDFGSGEVRKAGLRQKLVGQPFQVLQALLEQPGEIVTREDLRQRLWPDNTFVDYELALKKAVNRLREVLGDSAESPRFIETIPRRGYRFIGSLAAPSLPAESSEQHPADAEASASTKSWRHNRTAFFRRLITTFALLAIVGILLWLNAGKLRTRIFARSRSSEIHSIAVLPFENLSSDPEQEYFSDGMTDELITDLAKSTGLLVISHTSVQRYKNTKLPLQVIARELGVEAVVEGSVMRSGDRVRITAQLIDTGTDRHVWAESYERDIRDAISLQDEVTRQIAVEVGIKLAPNQQARTKARPISPAAHEAYLKGNFYWNRLNCRAFSRALDYFQQAVAQEPTYALAYVGVAESSFTLGDWGCRAQAEMFPQSKTAVLKAIELDGSIGAAHAWLGRLYFFYDWDWAKAEAEFKQGSELAPNDSATHLAYGVFLIGMGRQAEGLAKMRRAHELDPIAEGTNVVEGWTLYWAHDYDSTIEQEKRTIELYPGSSSAYHWLAEAYEQKGQYEQAIDAYIKEKEIDGSPPGELERLRQATHRGGLRAYWQQELERTFKGPDQCSLPNIYGHMGERQKQLEALSQAYRQHCRGLNFLKVDPAYDGVRNDESFREVITRMRL